METYRVEIDDRGTTRWYKNDVLDRRRGPAVEALDGAKYWYTKGLLQYYIATDKQALRDIPKATISTINLTIIIN